jgi:hypothetical protein
VWGPQLYAQVEQAGLTPGATESEMRKIGRPRSHGDVGRSPVFASLRWARARGSPWQRRSKYRDLLLFKRGKLVERELGRLVVDSIGRIRGVVLLGLINPSIDDLRGRLTRCVSNLDVDGDDSGLRAPLPRVAVGLFALVCGDVARQRRPTWLATCRRPDP